MVFILTVVPCTKNITKFNTLDLTISCKIPFLFGPFTLMMTSGDNSSNTASSKLST